MAKTPSTLEQAVALGLRDRKVFDWPNAQGALNKLEEEIGELKEAMSQNDTKETFAEFSDVFLTLLQVARHLNIDPDKNLKFSMAKYNLRYSKMNEIINNDKKEIQNLKLEELESYWQKAKKETETELEVLLDQFS